MNASSVSETRSLAAFPVSDRLSGWKEIAAYLRTSVRTVQRWESNEHLPVYRHAHVALGTVYAERGEIDQWLARRHSPARKEIEPRPHSGPASPSVRRLLVLPFRLLRADPDIEFLCVGLADAITASLSGIDSFVLRSPISAARYSGGTDLARIAKAADVHLLLVGTLLRSTDVIRVATQLVDGPTGTVLGSAAFEGSLQNIFHLQDEVVTRVIGSLSPPLSVREKELLHRDVPVNAAAYEHFIRANEVAADYHRVLEARDLYLQSVHEDPDYAPAWARLGRCYRVIAKFGCDPQDFARAASALRRAIELNPDLAAAHNQLAHLEADCGRAETALARLLKRMGCMSRDPELFSGLVHVCRFCGLLEASVAAHERAHRLDPGIRTSVCHTHFMRGHYDLALETSHEIRDFVGPAALAAMGKMEEAGRLASKRELTYPLPLSECMIASVGLVVAGDANALEMCERAIALITHGPEELFYQARHLAYLGEVKRAAAILNRSVDEGFFCYPALACDPWLERLRAVSAFRSALGRAQDRHASAIRLFRAAGGEQLFNTPDAS